jgi:hypothetical protein
VKTLPIEKLVRLKYINPGTYILTDFDLLSEPQTDLLRRLYSDFNNLPAKFNLLNHPGISLGRLDFLKLMNESGLNPFRCVQANKIPDDIKFPVFIRKGKGHDGKISNLFYNLDQLNQSVSNFVKTGYNIDELLVVEFIDTSNEEKLYKKYSAFMVGGTIIPRHIFFSNHWMIKGAKLATSELVEEEFRYLKENPRNEELKKAFDMAGIQYGRIDYSLKNNRLIVWEINSNPMIASSSSLKKSGRKKSHDYFSSVFIEAFKNLDIKASGEAILNPLTTSESGVKKVFPFNPLVYAFSEILLHVKSVLLFQFYLYRNRLTGKKDA